MSQNSRICAFMLCTFVALLSRPLLAAGPIGVNVATPQFVDCIKQAGAFIKDGGQIKTDASGWPTEDFKLVLFDTRVNMPWNGPDPTAVAPDESGAYRVRFVGKADITPENKAMFTIENMKHDEKTNISACSMVVPKGQNLIVLLFKNTAGGVKRLEIIRPGYELDSKKVFTDKFLKGLEPFDTLRLMDFASMNNHSHPGRAGAYPISEKWSDRRKPTDALQSDSGHTFGVAWEYGVALANETRKNIWINVPIGADDDYVEQFAKLLKKDLDSKLVVYVEYSNEVWNWGFCQSWWNQAAAKARVAAATRPGGDPKDVGMWHGAQYAGRTAQIADIFRKVYGDEAMMKTVRPVLAWQVCDTGSQRGMLQYVRDRFGPLNRYIYALATAPYCNSEDCSSVDAALKGMRKAGDSEARQYTLHSAAIARRFGIKLVSYEGGFGLSGADNVACKIAANRDPRATELMRHYLLDDWFAAGGDLFCYFNYAGQPGPWGCWGLIDMNLDLNTAKYKGVLEALQTPQPNVSLAPTVPSGVGGKLAIDEVQYLGCGNRKPKESMWLSGKGEDYEYGFIVQAQGTYEIAVGGESTEGGKVELAVDDAQPAAQPLPAKLTATRQPGLHVLTVAGRGKGRMGWGAEVVITRIK